MIYDLVDKYLMHDFTSAIADDLNKKNHKETLKILDIGCFQGNFSRNLYCKCIAICIPQIPKFNSVVP